MNRRTLSLLFAVLTLSACATNEQLYDRSIHDAAVFQAKNIRPLKPLVADPNGEVVVTTLKGSPWDLGPTTLRGDTWVTIVPEVQDRCRAYHGRDLAMRLRQMIGLPPTQTVTTFVTMRVQAAVIFRPAADPRTDTTTPCADVKDCTQFPPAVSDAHARWIGNAFLGLHQIPGGYPWSHLGYTWDWAPGADRYGSSEYIVPQGTPVTVLEATPIAEYCKP
jgi:hypothetical protein